jgi:putative thioredoxin
VVLAWSFVATDPGKAADLVVDIEEHSEHFPTVEAIRTFSSLTSRILHPEALPDDPAKATYLAALRELAALNHDTALEKFIEVIRNNRYYDDDGARKACIAIFRLLGDDHEVTRRRRREFSSALYT